MRIEAKCACTTTLLPFRLLRMQGKITDTTKIADMVTRLRCKRCGKQPYAWRRWHGSIDDGESHNPARTWGMMPPDGKS